jgi:type II secretory pathway pseudopilin PulG
MLPNRKIRHSERGYILLTLLLFVALLAIAAMAIAPQIVFEVKRDREEEMIHRGTQYSRAIRRFVKKSGRYPTRIEELENTNQVRFLRKKYKDPITGQDFKVLHLGDPQLNIMGSGLIGAGITAMTGTSVATQGGPGTQIVRGLSGPSGPGTQVDPGGEDAALPAPGAPGAAGQANQTPGDQNKNPTDAGPSTQQVFGGGPIMGVVSASKAEGIREFNKKKRYNQWLFIYDPTSDRGGLIKTPYQPPLQVTAPNVNGTPGAQSGAPGTPGGMPGSFGTPLQPQPPQQPPQQQQ